MNYTIITVPQLFGILKDNMNALGSAWVEIMGHDAPLPDPRLMAGQLDQLTWEEYIDGLMFDRDHYEKLLPLQKMMAEAQLETVAINTELIRRFSEDDKYNTKRYGA